MKKEKKFKYDRNFFKNLKERSAAKYNSVAALNWGEEISGKHIIGKRYHFTWGRPDRKKRILPLTIDVQKYILKYKELCEKRGRPLTVYVGVDSQNRLLKTNFVVSVVLYMHEKGGHELVSKVSLHKIYDYRYRLLREADMLGEVARELCPFLKESNIPFELHLDYNSSTNHKSNGVVQEALNYFKFLGYKAYIKPEAFAASSAADYFCK